MPDLKLDAVEARILGCLLEKERLTPENYPLSLHSLTAACNQSSNREPVVGYDEKTVEAGLYTLREKKLASLIHAAGARVQKYRHNLPDLYELNAGETALLCVLLLRGPQTPGELRTRTERSYRFERLEEVEAALEGLTKGNEPLARVIPAGPGQKEKRYVQLLSPFQAAAAEATVQVSAPPPAGSAAARLETVEKELGEVKGDLRHLREEFAAFRKQFE